MFKMGPTSGASTTYPSEAPKFAGGVKIANSTSPYGDMSSCKCFPCAKKMPTLATVRSSLLQDEFENTKRVIRIHKSKKLLPACATPGAEIYERENYFFEMCVSK
jgi:hypothetical protein